MNETAITVYEWVFDSNTCTVLGHRIGCADLRKAALYPGGKKRSTKIYCGRAATAEEVDDMGHPVKMCACTR